MAVQAVFPLGLREFEFDGPVYRNRSLKLCVILYVHFIDHIYYT